MGKGLGRPTNLTINGLGPDLAKVPREAFENRHFFGFLSGDFLSNAARPFAPAVERLRAVGLRPTKQRIALCRRLFDSGHRHLTAEALHDETAAAGLKISLATIYNTLHQFTRAGLLREVMVDGAKTYFDTNTTSHHHLYDAETGDLRDIPGDGIEISGLPGVPDGLEVQSVDITVRVRRAQNGSKETA